MENELISLETFCLHYQVEATFIQSLNELHVVEIVYIDNSPFIPTVTGLQIEKLQRLQNDFGLNANGLAVASHLLDKIGELQNEINLLRSRLRIYE